MHVQMRHTIYIYRCIIVICLYKIVRCTIQKLMTGHLYCKFPLARDFSNILLPVLLFWRGCIPLPSSLWWAQGAEAASSVWTILEIRANTYEENNGYLLEWLSYEIGICCQPKGFLPSPRTSEIPVPSHTRYSIFFCFVLSLINVKLYYWTLTYSHKPRQMN